MDSLNLKYGRGTLQIAAEGGSTNWRIKRERLSPDYTTDGEGGGGAGAVLRACKP